MIIEVKDLQFSYSSGFALRGINMSYDGGTLLLIGPNGAGKSTFIKLLSGFLKRSGGKCLLLGRDCESFYLDGGSGAVFLYEEIPPSLGITLKDLYEEVCTTRKCRPGKFLEYLNLLGIKERFLERKFKTLSAGEKKKAYLALGLSIDADVHIIDEVYAHIDAFSRIQVANLLQRVRGEGANLLLTTHIFDYMEALMDRVVMVYDGEVVMDMKKEDLVTEEAGKAVTVRVSMEDKHKALEILRKGGFEAKQAGPDSIIVTPPQIERVEELLSTSGIRITSIEFASIRSLLERFITERRRGGGNE